MPLLLAINRCRLSNLGVYSKIKPDATSSEQVESQQDEIEQINFENLIVESDHDNESENE